MKIRILCPKRLQSQPIITGVIQFLRELGHRTHIEAPYYEFKYPYFCTPSLPVGDRELAEAIAKKLMLSTFNTRDGTQMDRDGGPGRLLVLGFRDAILNLTESLLDPDGNY